MLSLVLNFLKRALIVPLALLLIAVAAVSAFLPRLNLASVPTAQGREINLSSYTLVNYKAFDSLGEDNYVGKLTSEDFDLGEIAVLKSSDNSTGVRMLKSSKEPWNGGGVILVGKNIFNQFKLLHNAKKGDTVTFEFYNNDSYNYKISKIVPNVRAKELNSYLKDNLLVMCVPYNDFGNLGDSYLYTVYVAQKVEG